MRTRADDAEDSHVILIDARQATASVASNRSLGGG